MLIWTFFIVSAYGTHTQSLPHISVKLCALSKAFRHIMNTEKNLRIASLHTVIFTYCSSYTQNGIVDPSSSYLQYVFAIATCFVAVPRMYCGM
jgi:hypothetical protein